MNAERVPFFLQGEGELRALFRAHDWSATPLGAPHEWPLELQTVADLMLNARYPAVVLWGHEHTFLYNDAYAYMLGGRHPEALGLPFAEVWPEIWPELRPAVEGAMAGRPAFFENAPVTIAPDGVPEQRWFTSSYSPVRDRNGQVVGMFNAGFETTAGVLGERRSTFQLAVADRLRPLSSPQDIVAAAGEMLGRHLDVARVAYAEIDEARGTFFIRRQWAQPGVSDISGDARPLDDFGPEAVQTLRSGQAMVVHDVAADPRTARHVDSYLAIGAQANLAVPLVKAGRLEVVLSVHSARPRRWTEAEVQLVQDVAERTWLAVETVRAEAELRETQALLSAMFDSLPVGVGVFDATGAVKLANQSMNRYMPTAVMPSQDPARGKRWRLSHADGSPVAPAGFPGARALQGERVVPGVEALYMQEDGRELWTQVAAVPIRNAEGRVTGQVSVVHEIDALKRTQDELRRLAADLAEANRRQSEFLAVLAHELRNPLAPILTGLELLRLRPDNADTARRVREIIERQTRQMVHLIDDLLDIARVTSGKIEIRRKLVDVHAVVATAVETSLPVIEKARHQLQVQPHEGALVLWADPTRLAQIVSNLLTNAAKYTLAGGTIRLAVEKDGEHATVSVSDNGIGIPADSLASIFDMFSQVQRGADESPGGLGIGLALVKQLVALHGGTVTATSDGAGHGSTFIVRLPLATEGAPSGDSTKAPSSGARGGLRILVADDNVDAAQSLAALLDMDGHETLVAHDGPQALQAATATSPDVVFLDIGMPGMTGYEVASRLRSMEALNGTRLVAVTGWGTEEDRAKARETGFDRHFTKPVSPEEIRRFLEDIER